MSKILLSFNESRYLGEVALLENSVMPLVQQVIDQYHEMEIERLTINDFLPLFKSPVDLIYLKMTGGKTTIDGMEVHKKNAIDLLQRPKGYTTFLNKYDEVTSTLKDHLKNPTRYLITSNNIGNYFEMDAKGNVLLIQSMKDKLKEQNKLYADSKKAKDVLAFVNDVMKSYNENGLNNYFRSSGDGISGVVKTFISHPFSKELNLNAEEIAKLNHQ